MKSKILLLLLIISIGCSKSNKSTTTENNVVPNTGAYSDYQWATEPKDYKTKKVRILLYLKEYDVKDEEWEDSVHINYVKYAKFSLLQCLYHLDELQEADELVKILMEEVSK